MTTAYSGVQHSQLRLSILRNELETCCLIGLRQFRRIYAIIVKQYCKSKRTLVRFYYFLRHVHVILCNTITAATIIKNSQPLSRMYQYLGHAPHTHSQW